MKSISGLVKWSAITLFISGLTLLTTWAMVTHYMEPMINELSQMTIEIPELAARVSAELEATLKQAFATPEGIKPESLAFEPIEDRPVVEEYEVFQPIPTDINEAAIPAWADEDQRWLIETLLHRMPMLEIEQMIGGFEDADEQYWREVEETLGKYLNEQEMEQALNFIYKHKID